MAQLSFTSRRGHRAISLLRSQYLGGSRSRSSSLARVGAPIYASNGAQQWAVQASSSSQRLWRSSSWRHGSAFFPVLSSKFLEMLRRGQQRRRQEFRSLVRKNTVKKELESTHHTQGCKGVSNPHPILGDGLMARGTGTALPSFLLWIVLGLVAIGFEAAGAFQTPLLLAPWR